MSEAERWLDTLPGLLAGQQDVLRRLLTAVEADPRWRWLQVGCSVAEGRADALSDLDLGLGVAEESWDAALVDLPVLVGTLGDVVDALYHRLPEMGTQHQRAFVQFAGGVQLDLLVVPATLPRGRMPESIMLYDPEGIMSEPWAASVLQADGSTVYEWAFLGWAALADMAKYLQRGSYWEALERLHEARTQVWRLWAVAHRIRYPGFGLTTVLDHPEAGVPPGIDETVATADEAALLRAASACATVLTQTSAAASSVLNAPLPDAFAAFVRRRLDTLPEH